MARYEFSKIKSTSTRRGLNKNKTYNVSKNSTTIYSSIPETDNDIYVITQPGDRLDLLAFQYYGNVNLWWYIAKANNLKFMTVDAGVRLRIPGNTEFAIGL